MIKRDDIGVEFGSGRSTLWLAKRMRHLTSVESDSVWYEKVRSLIHSAGLSSVVDYRKYDNESEYARQATLFTDNSIDFCLIDGVARDQCALTMLSKIKSGGIIVVDNINWYLPNDHTRSPDSKRSRDGAASDIWAAFAKEVSVWRHIWTSNGVFDTCIWFKP
ncbi:MAG: class I SAM-dependent methyltransferase [Proteobacteria bacterium]|nr:class I SAM-dependent methyltransferase [Pseudomonadota bacterium]